MFSDPASPRPRSSSSPPGHSPLDALIEQNRAFGELARALSTNEPALLTRALPAVLRGTGANAAIAYRASGGQLSPVAAEEIPFDLRDFLEDEQLTSEPVFLGQRALRAHRPILGPDVFGAHPLPEVQRSLEQARWGVVVAAPILHAGHALGVLLVEGGQCADPARLAFLDEASQFLALGLALEEHAVPTPSQRH